MEAVIACDKREAFAQGSAATKQSSFLRGNGLLRFARNDDPTLTVVIVRLDRTTQYSEASMMESNACGVLDTSPSRDIGQGIVVNMELRHILDMAGDSCRMPAMVAGENNDYTSAVLWMSRRSHSLRRDCGSGAIN